MRNPPGRCACRCTALASPATCITVGSLTALIKRAETYKPPDASSNVPHDSRAYDPNSFFSRMDIGQLYFQARGGEGAGRGAPPTQRS